MQKNYIEERIRNEANFMIDTGATVRQTAHHFGVSKSTIHNDVTVKLADVSPMLCDVVRKVLDFNKADSHIRGGLATREKYLIMKKNIKLFYSSNSP